MKIHLFHPFKRGGEEVTELDTKHVNWEEGHVALRVTIGEEEFVVPLSNVSQIDLDHRETIGAPRGLAHREYR